METSPENMPKSLHVVSRRVVARLLCCFVGTFAAALTLMLFAAFSLAACCPASWHMFLHPPRQHSRHLSWKSSRRPSQPFERLLGGPRSHSSVLFGGLRNFRLSRRPSGVPWTFFSVAFSMAIRFLFNSWSATVALDPLRCSPWHNPVHIRSGTTFTSLNVNSC